MVERLLAQPGTPPARAEPLRAGDQFAGEGTRLFSCGLAGRGVLDLVTQVVERGPALADRQTYQPL